jgi:hypothetical protein
MNNLSGWAFIIQVPRNETKVWLVSRGKLKRGSHGREEKAEICLNGH